jgi:aminoglycoside 3-N-acetyltransferase I
LAGSADYVLRRLGENDVELAFKWRDMFNTAFAEPPSPRPSAEYMRRLLADPKFIALAAVAGREVIGGIAAYELVKYERERSEIYIYDLAVAEPHRRRGIGRALIEAVKPIAREKGAWMIFVQADREDAPAIALYRSMGAEEQPLHFDIAPEA